MARFKETLLLVILLFCAGVSCEWVKVPLQTFDSFEREQPSLISNKMESLVLPFRVTNRTKQLDLELEQAEVPQKTINRRKDSKVTQVTKKRISEPFSFFGFIRSLRDSFFFRPQASVKDKVGFLERFRDNVLSEIKRRILNLFVPQQQHHQQRWRRSKRDLESSEHGHDFVSADGALVTICFLTFSVFLIKLVLQIIYIFKAKHQYQMTTTGGETGTVGAVRLVKLSRETDEEEKEQQTLRIMKAIY